MNYGFCLCLGWRHDGLAIVVLVLAESGMFAGFAYLGLLLLLFVIFFTLAIMGMEQESYDKIWLVYKWVNKLEYSINLAITFINTKKTNKL